MPANITYFTHFSGNFWWTRADYWHTLAPSIGPDYYDPERFLFTGKPRTACVYYTGFQARTRHEIHGWHTSRALRCQLTSLFIQQDCRLLTHQDRGIILEPYTVCRNTASSTAHVMTHLLLPAQGAAHYWMELPPREYTDVVDVSVVRVDS